jgi:hypothetical protein
MYIIILVVYVFLFAMAHYAFCLSKVDLHQDRYLPLQACMGYLLIYVDTYFVAFELPLLTHPLISSVGRVSISD